MAKEGTATVCPTDTATSTSSTVNTESISRQSYFAGGYPGEYLDLGAFCYRYVVVDHLDPTLSHSG